MNLETLKKNIQSLGLYNYCLHLLVKGLGRLTYTNVLVGMTLTPDSLDPKFLEADSKYTCRFLSGEEVQSFSTDPENDLPAKFVEEALSKGDLCYAVLEGQKLASYGWYTNQPTEFSPELTLKFSDQWIYMYRGYTLPSHRGLRLHGVGMARAMQSFVEREFQGLISYVESSNFNSLRSVYRMGYVHIGKIVVVRIFGKFVTWTTGRCSEYGLRLVRSD